MSLRFKSYFLAGLAGALMDVNNILKDVDKHFLELEKELDTERAARDKAEQALKTLKQNQAAHIAALKQSLAAKLAAAKKPKVAAKKQPKQYGSNTIIQVGSSVLGRGVQAVPYRH